MTSVSPTTQQQTATIPSHTATTATSVTRKPRGFAALKARGEIDRLKQIARKGATCCVAMQRNHQWTSQEARDAGRLGAAKRTERAQARRAAGAPRVTPRVTLA